MCLDSITFIGKLFHSLHDCSWIEAVLIRVEGGLWQDEVILMVLSCVRMGSLII